MKRWLEPQFADVIAFLMMLFGLLVSGMIVGTL